MSELVASLQVQRMMMCNTGDDQVTPFLLKNITTYQAQQMQFFPINLIDVMGEPKVINVEIRLVQHSWCKQTSKKIRPDSRNGQWNDLTSCLNKINNGGKDLKQQRMSLNRLKDALNQLKNTRTDLSMLCFIRNTQTGQNVLYNSQKHFIQSK